MRLRYWNDGPGQPETLAEASEMQGGPDEQRRPTNGRSGHTAMVVPVYTGLMSDTDAIGARF